VTPQSLVGGASRVVPASAASAFSISMTLQIDGRTASDPADFRSGGSKLRRSCLRDRRPLCSVSLRARVPSCRRDARTDKLTSACSAVDVDGVNKIHQRFGGMHAASPSLGAPFQRQRYTPAEMSGLPAFRGKARNFRCLLSPAPTH